MNLFTQLNNIYALYIKPSLIVKHFLVFFANSKLCVTIIIVLPSLFNCSKIFIICIVVMLSNEPVGSSAKISSGFVINALAIATLCLCPPDSILTFLFLKSPISNLFNISSNFIFTFLIELNNVGTSIFSVTVSSSIKPKSCNTKPIFLFLISAKFFSDNFDTSSPSNLYIPSVCLSIHPKMYNNVDFPDPETPNIEQKSPFSIFKFIFFNACTSKLVLGL